MICISPKATAVLTEQLKQETNDTKLTLLSAGVGCGAPKIKIELRPPLEDDIILNIDGITFRVRQNIMQYIENAEIEIEETYWGTKLKVITVFGCK